MSQYLSFYIRGKDEQFYPIAEFCRSSSYYEMFEQFVPAYDGLGAITENTLGAVRGDVAQRIKEIKSAVKRAKQRKQDILQANNSLDEKMESLCGCDEMIEDSQDELEAFEAVDYFINFLYNILDSINYRSDFEGRKEKYLYGCIEPMFKKDASEVSDEEREKYREAFL
jgi:hypothetical protein